jgi:hypothetical protein
MLEQKPSELRKHRRHIKDWREDVDKSMKSGGRLE